MLLRGLMRESRHWGEFRSSLQSACSGQPLVCLDFPGNGVLHQLNSATSVEAMAQHCHHQMQQLGLAPPYRVIALSLGAMVAVAWNALYPNDLEKLVLMNTSLAPYNPFYQRLRPQNYPKLLRFLLHGSPAQRERLILELTSNGSQPMKTENTLEQWLAYAQQYPIARSNILRQLFAAISYRAPITAPTVPTLLLAGQQDRLVNVQCSLTLACHWHCPIKIHPSAGHDLPLDEPDWLIREIQDWLKT